jgi:hypothetical protein
MLSDRVFNLLMWFRMQVVRVTLWRRIVQASKAPHRVQEDLLARILHDNRSTQFGQRHAFGKVRNYHDFAKAVRVQTYESLRPMVEEQATTGLPALTAEPPVMYAQTSGTTGKPKLIPLLAETLKTHRRNQSIQSYRLFEADPAAYRGHLLGIVSPSVEGNLASGVAYGSASGQVYKHMPALARKRYVVPAEVFAIDDYELKYLVILRLAIVHRDISFIGVANPSTLLKLAALLRSYRTELMDGLRHGTFWRSDELPSRLGRELRPRLICSDQRHKEIEVALERPEPNFEDLWPDIRLVVTWTGGSCGIALSAVKQMLPETARIVELGYMSSEFRGTITVDVDRNLCLPTIHENFFEFVERESWESGTQDFKLIDEVESGRNYYVFVTTSSGLYRYFMNDIVTVTGMFNQTPTIQFVQKGRGVTNITGEKVYESQVIEAVHDTLNEAELAPSFFLMLANQKRAVYRLMLECSSGTVSTPATTATLASEIDNRLGELNIEYRAKRASGRLDMLELVFIEGGTGDEYKKHCIGQGQREGQFKTVALQYDEDCSFDFSSFRVGSRSRVQAS